MGDLVGLRDHLGFVEAMHMLAVSHYITVSVWSEWGLRYYITVRVYRI